jgi:hypothetical protein
LVIRETISSHRWLFEMHIDSRCTSIGWDLLAFSLLTANLEAISGQDFRLLMPLFVTMFLIFAIVMLQT